MAFLSQSELNKLGFKSLGSNVLISDKTSIYNPAGISIASNVRIDDFCVLSAGVGGIDIGSNIHLAVFSSIIGEGRVILSDFCNISSRVSIYSSNDDYSGASMTNPMIPDEYKKVTVADVRIGRHVIIGSGSVILPGVNINDGAVVGALSLVNKNCEENKVYSGVPAKFLKERKQNFLELERSFLNRI
ncbi:galactoside O-acetyltransferase [Idiomarina tyrosinivorans]|uniref:Chloramphenicol acetyltransferase n=1 Tax=Idiomarina tyrosinivorans TaxID=1445662 RepID=A0A432ZR09_9GAMM|nr:acyltransferase [Idiomarina tyrosinivorans]RUO80266.1 galactoside O-acetyltransferase [Idiomarina tyrosinivorans]